MRPPPPPPPAGKWPAPPSTASRPAPDRPPTVSHRLPPAPPPLLFEDVFKPLAEIRPSTRSKPVTFILSAPPPGPPVTSVLPPRPPWPVGEEGETDVITPTEPATLPPTTAW